MTIPESSRDKLKELQEIINDLNVTLSEVYALTDVSQHILSAKNIFEIFNIFKTFFHDRFFSDLVAMYEIKGGEALKIIGHGTTPPKENVEAVISAESPFVRPTETGDIYLYSPLNHMGKVFGFFAADVTRGSEKVTQANLDALKLISAIASAAVYTIKLNARLREHDEMMTSITDSITNGIITIDKDHRVIQINRNAMLMLGIENDPTGMTFEEAVPESVKVSVEEILNELNQTGFAMERMLNQTIGSGTELDIAVSASLLRDETASIRGYILIMRDMTASKELERMRQIDEMKDMLMSNVSHELKTPLTSIRAYAEALLDMLTDGQQKEFAQVIIDETDRLVDLVNEFLQVSRIRTGKLKLKPSISNPYTIIDEALKATKIRDKKHEIVKEVEDGLPECYFDRDLMREVLINLISNAIKYSPKGGKVWVRLKKFENNLCYEVEDQGIGIPADHLPKLFEPFHRVDRTLTYEIPGTGLGLSIVRGIAQAHGGKVEVESQVDVGSKFSVYIPIRFSPELVQGREETWAA